MNKTKVPPAKGFRMYLMREGVDTLRVMSTLKGIKILLLEPRRKDALSRRVPTMCQPWNRLFFTPWPFEPYHKPALSTFRMKEGMDLAWGHSSYTAELEWRPDWGSLFPRLTQLLHLGAAGILAWQGLGMALALRWIWIPLGEKGKHVDGELWNVVVFGLQRKPL